MWQTYNTRVIWQYALEYPNKKLEDSFQDYYFLNTNFLIMYVCDYEKGFDQPKRMKMKKILNYN